MEECLPQENGLRGIGRRTEFQVIFLSKITPTKQNKNHIHKMTALGNVVSLMKFCSVKMCFFFLGWVGWFRWPEGKPNKVSKQTKRALVAGEVTLLSKCSLLFQRTQIWLLRLTPGRRQLFSSSSSRASSTPLTLQTLDSVQTLLKSVHSSLNKKKFFKQVLFFCVECRPDYPWTQRSACHHSWQQSFKKIYLFMYWVLYLHVYLYARRGYQIPL